MRTGWFRKPSLTICLETVLGWESVYAWNQETFGPDGTLGRRDTREVVLTRDLRAALERLNPDLPAAALEDAVQRMTHHDFSRSVLQHNQGFHDFIGDGVPVRYKDASGRLREKKARVIDFEVVENNRFLAVRELKITGLRAPSYNRRADLICFVNGLRLVFIELKAVYKNIRAGFDGNLSVRLHGRERDRARVPPTCPGTKRICRWWSGRTRTLDGWASFGTRRAAARATAWLSSRRRCGGS